MYQFGKTNIELRRKPIDMGKTIIFFLACLLSQLCIAQEKKLAAIIPHYTKLQFAGGIGFFSLGVGYNNRKEKLEGDLYYGYVPKKIGGDDLHAITGKLTWLPLKGGLFKKIHYKPLSFGLLVNYTFGKQFFLFDPELYPYKYYGFPTALHVGGFIGGQASVKTKKLFNKVGLYYELGTMDALLISYLNNEKDLTLPEIFNLGIGIKGSF